MIIMATTKKRVNISLSKDLEKALGAIAKRDRVPVAAKAAELVRLGLEIEEDVLLEQIASRRYRTAKKWLSHEDLWGA